MPLITGSNKESQTARFPGLVVFGVRLTVIVFFVLQPVVLRNVIVVDPEAIPVTTPFLSTVAVVILLEVQGVVGSGDCVVFC